MSWDSNLPKAASNKASKIAKGFVCINIRIIKYSNIVDHLFEYPNILVGENPVFGRKYSKYSNISEYSSHTASSRKGPRNIL